MIITQNKQTINLKGSSTRIVTLSTAYNGFVFVQLCDNPANIQKLVHVDVNGNRLKQFSYVDSVDTFGMFNERQVIVMNVSKNLIDIIDLSTYEIRSYPHKYSFPDTVYMDIHLFHNTKIFCIQQKGSTGDHRLILSYYSYDIKQILLIERFQSTAEWNCQNFISKLNNNSKIGWWKNSQNEKLQFYVYEVNKNEGRPLLIEGQLRKVIMQQQQEEQRQNSINISNMWQMTDNNYLLVCNVAKKNKQSANSNFVFDANKGMLRQSKFILPNSWNHNLIDYYYLGEISVFHTFLFQDGKILQSPVYYINNERQEIIAEDTWKCSNQTQFYVPGFDSSMVIETFRQHGNSEKIQVNTIKLVTLKEMYLHFLLHIEQDFDDDLLSDAIDLLE